MHHVVVQEGVCTTWWSRRGYAPRGPGGGMHHVVQEGGLGGGVHHVVQEGACTTWSRRGRAPRGPGGGVHHVVQEGACTTWSRRGRAPRGPGGGVHHVVQEGACTNNGRSKRILIGHFVFHAWLASYRFVKFTVYMNVLLMSKQKESFQKKGQNDQHLVLVLIVGSEVFITGLEDCMG